MRIRGAMGQEEEWVGKDDYERLQFYRYFFYWNWLIGFFFFSWPLQLPVVINVELNCGLWMRRSRRRRWRSAVVEEQILKKSSSSPRRVVFCCYLMGLHVVTRALLLLLFVGAHLFRKGNHSNFAFLLNKNRASSSGQSTAVIWNESFRPSRKRTNGQEANRWIVCWVSKSSSSTQRSLHLWSNCDLDSSSDGLIVMPISEIRRRKQLHKRICLIRNRFVQPSGRERPSVCGL